ncbi:undecaprenyl/decaprenyl-phosphate alpha-N-acetylglucosaminyl 1-phosphate transferase [Anaerobacillus alkaliphilus]|uniref:Undecaprenyl/decaprenyl-phosphate alpha-N-acetylglucosaminyl 1-phosphate transferase n=1 Tax=Anaerobacillus alkaliphilus TaxID=1548597 RepID=A0A4Q0VX47_9BACI|nr:MraY family glycosyltransferase [Anaerobacillus alkaliphilus]RXJ02960.1 undecaprenyl/decaprenyl-phosphate alpha-N-acetylglucosaminyl 1-phosphate transferase [Anaerobacillus alkaliphilus]
MILLTFLLCFLTAVAVTPLVKNFAIKIGATDKPNHRKVHQKLMPRLGGLAIYIAFLAGFIFLQPQSPYLMPILLGSFVIIVTGFLDDMLELSAKWKLAGQILAAGIVVWGGVQVNFINLPFDGRLDLGWFAIPLTLLWIVGITNAINLIDGLDGLAAGVSSIVLATLAAIAFMMGNMFVVALALILMGSTLGFLIYNFNPAKIFMGDTGALFLGFMISVISLLGFKNVTLFSLLVPVIILGVPISDTLFAIIRRLVNKKPLSAPDKSHLHHCLLRLGYSHRKTVLVIYAMSSLFGLAAILLTQSTLWGAFLIVTLLIIGIELMVEMIGLVSNTYKPMLNFLSRIGAVRKI